MTIARGLAFIALTCLITGCPGPKKGGKNGPKGAGKTGPISQHPVGTGPFIFKTWKRDSRIVLEANPDYWGGKAKFDKMVVIPVKEHSTRLAKLEEGSVHILDGLRPTDAKALAGNKSIKVLRQPGLNMGYLSMNVEKAPFNNKKVRQAVALCIDKEKIIKLNYQGYASAAIHPMPPSMLGYDKSIVIGERDLDKAKTLIAESGVKLPIKTELWHMPIARPYMPEPKKIATLIRENLKEIGIEAELVTKKWEFYLKETKEGKHPMCLLGWTADVVDPDNFLYVLLGKDNINGTNVSRYANPKINTAFHKAQKMVFEKRRDRLYRKVLAVLADEVPMVPLVHSDQLMAYRSNVKGFHLHQTGTKTFKDVEAGTKTLVFARGGDSAKLDPARIDDGESVVIVRQVYEPLVKYDQGSTKIVPCLATKWEANAAKTEWTFELRQGVKFHDGTPFNADAVIFNFDRIINEKNPHHPVDVQNKNLYSAITKIEKLGDHKVKFVLSEPVATFLGNLTVYTAHIVSPTAIKQGEKTSK